MRLGVELIQGELVLFFDILVVFELLVDDILLLHLTINVIVNSHIMALHRHMSSHMLRVALRAHLTRFGFLSKPRRSLILHKLATLRDFLGG